MKIYLIELKRINKVIKTGHIHKGYYHDTCEIDDISKDIVMQRKNYTYKSLINGNTYNELAESGDNLIVQDDNYRYIMYKDKELSLFEKNREKGKVKTYTK